MHALSLFCLLSLAVLISAFPMPMPGYRIAVYGSSVWSSVRGNIIFDGVNVGFSAKPNNLYKYYSIQPNVSDACTTWRGISASDNMRRTQIYMSLVGITLDDFLKLNPDVPRDQLVSPGGGLGTGLTPKISYCWGTKVWPEKADYVTYKVPLSEFNGSDEGLM
jgi:hypothetical protein